MKANLSALAAGLLFGMGLMLSGMTNPGEVLGFLDWSGVWSPDLMGVLGSAVLVSDRLSVGATQGSALV